MFSNKLTNGSCLGRILTAITFVAALTCGTEVFAAQTLNSERVSSQTQQSLVTGVVLDAKANLLLVQVLSKKELQMV
jgi:hypothetical protein